MIGSLYLNDVLVDRNTKFFYSNVVNRRLSYKTSEKFNMNNLKDEIKFKITDGKFTTAAILQMKLKPISKDAPTLIKNDGLSAVSGLFFYEYSSKRGLHSRAIQ